MHQWIRSKKNIWLQACHACQPFQWNAKSMIHDIGSRHNGGSNQLDKLKSFCHHSLGDLCVQNDDVCWKLKKYCHWKNNGNYPDGFIICVKSFYFGCLSTVKDRTWLHGVLNLSWFVFFLHAVILINSSIYTCFKVNCISLASIWHKWVSSCKCSCCHKNMLLSHWH